MGFRKRMSTGLTAGATAGAILIGVVPAAVAAGTEPRQGRAESSAGQPQPTSEQIDFISAGMGPAALAYLEAAGRGAVSRQPEVRVLPCSGAAVIAAGKASGKKTYVQNAVIGCLGGEIGGWAWRVLPGWAKNKAVHMVIAFVIRYIR